MPERPKRRKNKNKRKNKNNNRSDIGNNSVVNDTSDDKNATTSAKINLDGECKPPDEVEEKPSYSENNTSNINLLGNNEAIENSDSNIDAQNQDLNNNSDASNLIEEDNTIQNEVQELHIQELQEYVVESPDQTVKSKPKLNNSNKSKSLDNDDAPKITEITDDASCEDDTSMNLINISNVIVSDVESDIDWEKTDDLQNLPELQAKELVTGTLSITTIPLSIAQCDHPKTLTPEEETSLRHYLQTLNLSTNPSNSDEIKTEIEQIINREIRQRLRKKGLAEDISCQRLGPPRILDVIDEEGSSESSLTSRRQSYLSDKKSDNEDLEDDVFEDKNKINEKQISKTANNLRKKYFGHLVPQECVLVGAQIKEPEISEARGNWTVKTLEKMVGAEVVYLTDSSSSASSIHDIEEETDDGVETDATVRMITPTIEVTDTDSLLKNTFVCNDDKPKELKANEKPRSDLECSKNKDTSDTTIDDNMKENSHEIIVLSTDNIKTNLYVKDIDDTNMTNNLNKVESTIEQNHITDPKVSQKDSNEYNLEIKVLKCELNDAINNLIKEVVSDSETMTEISKDTFARQDSSSSVSSSQCTAKYNPTYSSLNDVSNMLHDEISENSKTNEENPLKDISHVKDVFEHVTGSSSQNKDATDKGPLQLRDLCLKKITTFPYGDKILEELASVSQRLQNITIQASNSSALLDEKNTVKDDHKIKKITDEMPYFPLPDLSAIETVSLSTRDKESVPPPVQPRNSSLRKSQDDQHWTGLPTKVDPIYVCLSPSQKMLMEKTKTVVTKEDATQLIDMHKKYVDRRGYNEVFNKDLRKTSVKSENQPVVPFKSQTGSRLLALIRDPSVTCNINTSMNAHNHKSVDQLYKKYSHMEATPRISNNLQLFKPIPPPRPKKYSSSFYESDESSDFTDSSFRSMKNERKHFHYSTGNLSKEIENDISSIQNMHRYYTDMRDEIVDYNCPRRPSLPKDLCDQQMEYIRRKEKEVEAEIKRLEGVKSNMVPEKKSPRAPLLADDDDNDIKENRNGSKLYLQKDHKSQLNIDKKEISNSSNSKLNSLFSSSQEEILRDKMYSEYVNQMAERQERRHHKIIKISNAPPANLKTISKSMSALDFLDSKVNNRIEKEFISKARERWNKLGIHDPETEDERDSAKDVYKEPKIIEHKIKVIDDGEEKEVQNLPSHLQDFVRFTAKEKQQGSSPGESESEPASPHVVVLCAVFILVFAVGEYFMRLLRRKS